MNRLLGLLLLLAPNLSFALPSDTRQPIRITSDQAEFNQRSNTFEYQGHVVALQGTTKLSAEHLIVHFNQENKIDKLQALGHPAVYSTLTSLQRKKLIASADIVEFNPLQSTVQLIGKGHVSQEGNIMEAPHIVIDIANERVVSKPSPQGKTTIVLQPQQRVKPDDKFSRSQRADVNKTQTTSR
jgi:lipopolysaccharide export system protein LptA